MKRVLLTGAAGFIGRTLAERLRADGVEVAGVDVADYPSGARVAGAIGTRDVIAFLAELFERHGREAASLRQRPRVHRSCSLSGSQSRG